MEIVGTATPQVVGTYIAKLNELGKRDPDEVGILARPMRIVRSVSFNDYCVWWEAVWGRRLTVSELIMLKQASSYWYEVVRE